MIQFDFYLRGFNTRYSALPTEQCYQIYATSRDGNREFTGLHYEHGELKLMLEQNVIVMAYDEEKIDEAA